MDEGALGVHDCIIERQFISDRWVADPGAEVERQDAALVSGFIPK